MTYIEGAKSKTRSLIKYIDIDDMVVTIGNEYE